MPSVVFWGDPKAARGKRCLVSSYCWILVNLQKYTHTQGVTAFPFLYLEDNLCKRSGGQLDTMYPGRVSGSHILSLVDQ